MPTQRVRIDKRQPLTELLSIAKGVNCSCKYQDLLSNKSSYEQHALPNIYKKHTWVQERSCVSESFFLDETMVSTLVKIYFLSVTIYESCTCNIITYAKFSDQFEVL